MVATRTFGAYPLIVLGNSRKRVQPNRAYGEMAIGDLVRTRPVPLLYGLMFVSLIALLPLPPLLQNEDYHQFADQRELFGIPNFLNVVSNLPFIVIGVVGLLRFHRNSIALVLFAGIFLTG